MPGPVPQGFRTVTPYLVVPDAAKVMDFMQRAFGATERYKMQGSDGAVSHAEMQVGDSVIMLGQSPDQTRTTHSMLSSTCRTWMPSTRRPWPRAESPFANLSTSSMETGAGR